MPTTLDLRHALTTWSQIPRRRVAPRRGCRAAGVRRGPARLAGAGTGRRVARVPRNHGTAGLPRAPPRRRRARALGRHDVSSDSPFRLLAARRSWRSAWPHTRTACSSKTSVSPTRRRGPTPRSRATRGRSPACSSTAARARPRVAIFCENCVDGACADLACLLNGILVSPINVHTDAGDTRLDVRSARHRHVVTDSDERVARLADVRDRSRRRRSASSAPASTPRPGPSRDSTSRRCGMPARRSTSRAATPCSPRGPSTSRRRRPSCSLRAARASPRVWSSTTTAW